MGWVRERGPGSRTAGLRWLYDKSQHGFLTEHLLAPPVSHTAILQCKFTGYSYCPRFIAEDTEAQDHRATLSPAPALTPMPPELASVLIFSQGGLLPVLRAEEGLREL